MSLEFRGQTDVGCQRDHNEDSLLLNDSLGLFVVADGMGGHAGGETASRLAVEAVEACVKEGLRGGGAGALDEAALVELLRRAVREASASIHRHALQEPALSGMGTTVTAMLVDGATAFFAHVGDSRAYLVREGSIQAITEDHSMVQEQLRAGMLTPEEARTSRFKNIITRAVGFEDEVEVDVMAVEAEAGDTFVLCSDGLSNMVEDPEIAQMATRLGVSELPGALIDLANARGGDDNITVIAVRLDEPAASQRS